MKRLGLVSLFVFALAAAGPAASADRPEGHRKAEPAFTGWTTSVIDPDQNFRGLAAVSPDEAWVSGESLSGGAAKVFHTVDAGKTWDDVTPPGTDGLSLRDVEVTHDAVHVLAIGPGEASVIFRSTDGGSRWRELFRNDDENAFYDCMTFYPGGRHGLAISDPVDGKIRMLGTDDGGRSWRVLPNEGMPDSAGEAGFAASGDCLTTVGKSAFLITGGAKSRVLRSDDRGLTWTAVDSGIPAGDAAGGFAGAFANPRTGIAVGGDFADPANTSRNTAYTADGWTWTNGADLSHVGEDVTFLRGNKIALATGDYGGSSGTSLTGNAGRSWTRVSDTGFHTLDCVGRTCWAAGAKGGVGRS